MSSELERLASRPARLARLGFTDGDRADLLAGRIGISDDALARLGQVADPDVALESLAHLLDAAAGATALDDRHNALALHHALESDDAFRGRLFAVLGSSAALGDHLATHPGDWTELADPDVDSARPSWLGLRTALLAAVEGKTGAVAQDALRSTYRRLLMRLAARDLVGGLDFDDVAAELADLAAATLDAALAIARAELPPDAAPCRLAVIGMGKCGGRELNYVSDVDVVFVAEPIERTERTERTESAEPAGGPTSQPRCDREPAGDGDDPGLRADLAGRRGAAARRQDRARWCARWPAMWPTTSAGPRRGSSRRC